MLTPVAEQQAQSWASVLETKWMQEASGLPGIRSGLPVHPTGPGQNIPGTGRKKLLLAGGIGFHPVMDGERRRKTVRASEITQDFVQINALVTAYGEKTLDELIPKAEGEKKEKKAKGR
jgi:hypothetical protein